jgi:LCP family protein required for cell wall assembly
MPPKYKRKLISFKQKLIPRLPIIAGFIILVLIVKFITSGIGWLRGQGLTTKFFNSLIRNDPVTLVRNYKGRTNILLLGVAGGNHSGRDLTDTIIFVSIDLKTADVLMVSLPRDIWSPTLQDKINSAYHYGETKKQGGGLVLAKSIAEEILGQPIHYAVVVDFEGFKDAVDTVGGLKVNVKEPFVDKKFPIQGKEDDKCDGDPDFGCRYETISFKKGVQIMDGKTALKYVRSRNAQGRQGTDFARSQRQQQVLFAFREKATSLGILANPLKLKELYTQFGKTVETDAQLSELLVFAKVATKFKGKSIRRITLDNGDEEQEREGWLYTPPKSRFGRWVLYPITDSFNIIHELVTCNLESSSCDMKPEDYK